MENENLVHQEWNRRLVPSNHGKNIWYRVSFWSVRWSTAVPSNFRPAFTIFMQDGHTADFEEAKKKREIRFRTSAHILIEDTAKVIAAMVEILKERTV